MLVGIVAIKIVGDHSIENSVAQVFEPLVVGPVLPVKCLDRHRAVHKSEFIQKNVMRQNAGCGANKSIKLPILREKELYVRYDV